MYKKRKKGLVIIYHQEIIQDISLFTSAPKISFYDNLFLNIDLSNFTDYSSKTERTGYSKNGLVHHVETTSANEHDVTVANKLMDGEEETLHGDSGYLGAQKQPEAITQQIWKENQVRNQQKTIFYQEIIPKRTVCR